MNSSSMFKPSRPLIGRSIKAIIGTMVLAVALSGCGDDTLGPANQSPIGLEVPDFKVPPIKAGGDVSLSSMKGSPVVLYFWATWCGPCRQFAPVLDKLTEEFEPKGAKFMAISTDDELKVVQTFESEHPHKSPTYWDRNHEVQAMLGVESLPSIMVVDKAGKVAYMTAGINEGTGDKIAELLNSALGG